MKICGKCKIEKELSEFYTDKTHSDGLTSTCKECKKSHENRKYISHPLLIFTEEQRRAMNLARVRAFHSRHPGKHTEYGRRWKKKYPEKAKIIRNRHLAKKRRRDPNFKILTNLRTRLNQCLKGRIKSGSSVKDLGLSMEDFRKYLELKFQPGMTWENYGLYGWHIDHIVPLSSFNLTDRQEFLKATHYSNLQPLWAKDNLRKSDTLDFTLTARMV